MGSESRQRNYRTTLRMNEKEDKMLKQQAQDEGLTDQDFIRAKLFNSPPVGRPRRAPRS